MAEKPFLTEFNTSITRIQQLVRDRQANNNQLLTTISDNINAIDAKVEQLKEISESVVNRFQQFRDELQRCQDTSARQQQQIAECERALEECATTKLAIQQELEQLKQGSKAELDAKQQLIDKHEATIRDLTEQIEPLKHQIEVLNQEKTALEARITELTRQNEEKDKIILQIEEKDRQIQTLTASVQEKTARIEEITQLVDEKERQIQGLIAENEGKDRRIQELQRELTEVSAERERKEEELVALRAENADFVERIKTATRIINESMDLLDQMRSAKREEDKAALLRKFQSTSATIERISNSLQAIRGGGKRYNKNKKSRKTRKTRKIKKFRGGFTYGTSSSFRRKSNKSSSSSYFKNRKTNKKYNK